MRTASEAIRELERRVAQLEEQVEIKEVPISLGIMPIPYHGTKVTGLTRAAEDWSQVFRRLGAKNYNPYAWKRHPENKRWLIQTFKESPEVVGRIREWADESRGHRRPQIEARDGSGRFLLFLS